MWCVLCAAAYGVSVEDQDVVVFGGSSLCLTHFAGVLDMADYVRLDMHNQFNLLATADALRAQTQNKET